MVPLPGCFLFPYASYLLQEFNVYHYFIFKVLFLTPGSLISFYNTGFSDGKITESALLVFLEISQLYE